MFCYRGETKELQEKLAKSEEELAKANEAMKSKTIVVQKLQKLGRSYRMKFEESSKELEELKESTQVRICPYTMCVCAYVHVRACYFYILVLENKSIIYSIKLDNFKITTYAIFKYYL